MKSLEKEIEKQRLSFKRVIDSPNNVSQFTDVKHLIKKDNYIISEWSFLGNIDYYTIHYLIDNEVYCTISTITAMKGGKSILTTNLNRFKPSTLEGSDIKFIKEQIVFDANDLREEQQLQMKKFINEFIEFILNHEIVRVRNLVGNYELFYQDDAGRREWKSMFQSI